MKFAFGNLFVPALIKLAGKLARKELDDIAKQVDTLKRQLQKTAKRLKHALS